MQETQTENPDKIQDVINKGNIYLVDKPLDFTSADIVRIFKKSFHHSKVGHSGTLDPKATGLLILCSGKMTKRINEYIEYDKGYEGIIKLGATTRSFDTENEEENIVDSFELSEEDIEETRKSFLGEIEQMPPMYSAIKFKGKPLYKIARKGREIERKLRKIFVSEFDIKILNTKEIFFRISSSKGTYIRSIADDFGKKLGVGGYLKELRRTRIGKYELKDLNENINGIKYKVIQE